MQMLKVSRARYDVGTQWSRKVIQRRPVIHKRVAAMARVERADKNPPWLQEIEFPARFGQVFKQHIDALSGELNWKSDSTTFEQKVSEILYDTCDPIIMQQLVRFTQDKSYSAMLLKGLPVEDSLPATIGDPPIAKSSQLAEALVFGFSSLWGHAFGYEGMEDRGFIRDLIACDSAMYSSTTELKMHRDFAIATERFVPHLRLILCMRPDKARQVETLICDNRELLQHLTDKDIRILKTDPITFYGADKQAVGGAKPTITGTDDNPCVNLFDVGVFGKGAGYRASDPAAVESYNKAATLAYDIALGVKLTEGQMLVINNNMATHARTESPIEPDGYGRWLKVTHVRSDIDPRNRYVAQK
jgi:hypothetical protein